MIVACLFSKFPQRSSGLRPPQGPYSKNDTPESSIRLHRKDIIQYTGFAFYVRVTQKIFGRM